MIFDIEESMIGSDTYPLLVLKVVSNGEGVTIGALPSCKGVMPIDEYLAVAGEQVSGWKFDLQKLGAIMAKDEDDPLSWLDEAIVSAEDVEPTYHGIPEAESNGVTVSYNGEPLAFIPETHPGLVVPTNSPKPLGKHTITKAPVSLAIAQLGDCIAPSSGDTDLVGVYWCVAISDLGWRAVTRFVVQPGAEGGVLGIKIGGHSYGDPALVSLRTQLKAIGMAVGQDYASLHVNCKTYDLARKTVGSVLAGSRLSWNGVVWEDLVIPVNAEDF